MSAEFDSVPGLTTGVVEHNRSLTLVIELAGVGSSVAANTSEYPQIFDLIDFTVDGPSPNGIKDITLAEITVNEVRKIGAQVLRVPVFELDGSDDHNSSYASSFCTVDQDHLGVTERRTIVDPDNRSSDIKYEFVDVTASLGLDGMVTQLETMRAVSEGSEALHDPFIPELFQLLVLV